MNLPSSLFEERHKDVLFNAVVGSTLGTITLLGAPFPPTHPYPSSPHRALAPSRQDGTEGLSLSFAAPALLACPPPWHRQRGRVLLLGATGPSPRHPPRRYPPRLFLLRAEWRVRPLLRPARCPLRITRGRRPPDEWPRPFETVGQLLERAPPAHVRVAPASCGACGRACGGGAADRSSTARPKLPRAA